MFDDKDPSSEMQVRVLIAFGLSALVLILFAPKPKPRPVPSAPNAPITQTTTQSSPSASSGLVAAPVPATKAAKKEAKKLETPAPAAAEQETELSVQSDLYNVRFSNRGGVVTSWVLKKFQDSDPKSRVLDLVNPSVGNQMGWPLSIYTDDAAVRGQLNTALFVAKLSSPVAPATLTFEYSDGAISARKEFRFTPDSYIVRITTEVTRDGEPVPHELAWRGGFGDRGLQKFNLANTVTESFAGKQTRHPMKDIKGDMRLTGPFNYVTIEDLFFGAVFMPDGDTTPGSFPGAAITRNEFALAAGDPLILEGVAAGGEGVNHLRLFAGPKDLAILRKIAPDPRNQAPLDHGQQVPSLGSIIDFGWFWFIAEPMFFAMKYIYTHWVANYGWAIVLLTIAINVMLFPIKLKGMKSALKMQKLAPQVAAIQNRYKKYKMNDPKKQEANEEIMALYKKEGVNPLGGCMPMLLQLPFFYGFYNVLKLTIEMRQASWMWIGDLSQAEPGWLHILPIIMLVSQVAMQKMTPQTTTDPVQQKMFMLMPLMFTFMFYNFSSGLVLYWLVSNIMQVAQQWYINKTGKT